jgi:hypothetical protein
MRREGTLLENATATTTCPACNDPADGAARYCACGEDLSPLFAERWAEEAEERARREFAEGGVPAIPEGAWRWRYGARMWFAVATTPVVAVAIAACIHVAFPFMLRGNPQFLLALGGLAVLGPFIVWNLLRSTVRVRPPHELLDADTTFRTFVHSLMQSRFEYAWHLLLPQRRAEERRRPPIELLGTRALTIDYSHPELLGTYWLNVFQPDLRAGTATKLASIVVEADGDDRAVGRAEFEARRQRPVPLWIAAPITAGVAVVLVTGTGLWLTAGPLGGAALYFAIIGTQNLFPLERTTLVLETRLVRIGGRWFVHDASLVPQLQETP